MLRAHALLALAPPRDAVAGPLKLDIKVHAEDTRAGVIFHAEIDVL